MKFYYVYVLRSKIKGKFYIGYTSDLKNRLKEHNDGKGLATRPFKPYELVYYEAFLSKGDAKNREGYLKTGWGWRSVKKIIKNYLLQ